jgi:hypothetical protein
MAHPQGVGWVGEGPENRVTIQFEAAQAGEHTIALFNDPANSATADGCGRRACRCSIANGHPNLDRFQIAPVRVHRGGGS